MVRVLLEGITQADELRQRPRPQVEFMKKGGRVVLKRCEVVVWLGQDHVRVALRKPEVAGMLVTLEPAVSVELVKFWKRMPLEVLEGTSVEGKADDSVEAVMFWKSIPEVLAGASVVEKVDEDSVLVEF